jgi:hypothetical protein
MLAEQSNPYREGTTNVNDINSARRIAANVQAIAARNASGSSVG